MNAQRPLSSEEMNRMIFDALRPGPLWSLGSASMLVDSSRTFLAAPFDQTMAFEFKTVIGDFQHTTAALLADYLARRRQIAEPAA